jgi:hypothetical protein
VYGVQDAADLPNHHGLDELAVWFMNVLVFCVCLPSPRPGGR